MKRELFTGYQSERDLERFEANLCTLCGKKISLLGFCSEASVYDYFRNGMCGPCQQAVYGIDPETFQIAEPFFDEESRTHEVRYNLLTLDDDYIHISQSFANLLYRAMETKEIPYYHMIEHGNQIWLYGEIENAGDHVFFKDKRSTKSDGFGGATLTFPLEDGSMMRLQGPWHSNPDSMKAQTGVDLTKRHLTFSIIARQRLHSRRGEVYNEILGGDDWPVVDEFDFGEKRAKALANNLGEPVGLCTYSVGGSRMGMVKPD